MANDLRIQIVVDAAQVTAGISGVTSTVEAATARIKSAFGSIANAPEGIQNALKVLQNQSRMSADAIATATAAITALGGASSGAADEVEKLASSGQDAAVKMSSMERAMALATGRMAGMAAGAGMLGGALGRVGAASSTLGPILAAAFPVIAIVALVDILALAYDKIIEVTSGFAGWDKEAQQMYDLLIGLNQQTVAFNANLAIEKLRLNEIGLKGTALDLQKEKDLKGELAIRTNELTASLQRENAIRTQLQGTSRTVEILNPRTRTSQQFTVVDQPSKDEVTRLNKELEKTVENSQKLQEEVRKLKEVSIPEAGKKGAKDYAGELERAAEFNDKLIADTKKRAEEDLKALEQRKRLEKEAEQALDKNDTTGQDIRDMRLRDEADEASVQARLDREKAAAITNIEIEQEKVKTLARMGQISADDEARQLNDLEAKKLQVETAYLQDRIQAVLARMADDDAESYKKDKAEWDKLLAEKQKAEDNYQKTHQKNIDKAATDEQKVWDRLGQGIMRSLDSAVQGITSGTERFGTAFARMVDNMLAKFIEAVLQMAEQWVLTHVFMLAVKRTAQHEEVLTDAKAAAAAAWKATAGIPVIGPVLAPIAAATAFAGVEAFSAEGGMVVPADNTLSLLHANEMVLPANLSAGLKDLIGNGSAGGGDIHVHYSPQVSAVDASGVENFFHRNQPALVKAIRTAVRRANV